MKFFLFFVTLAFSNLLLATGKPTLKSSDPKTIVATSDTVELRIRGTDFENEGHPERAQYMHWQVRRNGGPWSICISSKSSAEGTCSSTGWSTDSETIQLSGKFVSSPGTLEFRLSRGLENADAADPTKSQYGQTSPWTNILKINVIGEPPVITSLEPAELPNDKLPKGTPAEKLYQFRINGKNFGNKPIAVIGNFNDGMKIIAHTNTYVDVVLPEGHRPKGPEEKELPVKVSNVEYNLGTEPFMIKIRGEAPKKLNIGAPTSNVNPALQNATTVQTQAPAPNQAVQPTVQAPPKLIQPTEVAPQTPPKLIQPGQVQPVKPRVPTIGH